MQRSPPWIDHQRALARLACALITLGEAFGPLGLVATASATEIFRCEQEDASFTECQTMPFEDGERVVTFEPGDAAAPHALVLKRAQGNYQHHALGGDSFDASDWYTASLVAVNVFATFGDGKIDKQQTC